MKILHVIPSMNPKLGGPAEGIRNYEYGLKEFSHISQTVVCFDNADDATNWSTGNLTIIALGRVSNSLQYHPKFKKWLREFLLDYNIVMIDGLWLYHSYATVSIVNELKSKGIITPKIFVMPHGMLDPWFQKASGRRLKAIRNTIYWHLIEKKVVNSAQGILFTCQEELELARTTFSGYNPKAELNVGFGIAPPPLQLSNLKNVSLNIKINFVNKSYFLFLSRIHPKKGIDSLINAYVRLLIDADDDLLDLIPDLVIAGPGIDSDYGTDIMELINKNVKFKSRIHIVGMLLGESKWKILYECEAFVLPSHQENFGIAVVEALVCSKPVLISNQVNIWKEIYSAKAGLIEEDTDEGTYKLLKSYLDLSDSEKSKMKQQAIYTFNTFFDVRATTKKLLDAIE